MGETSSRIKGAMWLVLAISLGVVFALGIGPFVRAVPWSFEQKVADVVGGDSFTSRCDHKPANDVLLKRLVQRIYPLDAHDQRFSIDVHVTNDNRINAFAGLGGKIYLNKGLLIKAQSPEEIAAVLSHEIEHVRRRHILEGFTVHLITIQGLQMIFTGSAANAKWANFFLSMGFSRKQEALADEGALERLQKAHVDNKGFKEFFKRMAEEATIPTFLSDHPSDEDRFELASKYSNEGSQPIMTTEEWSSLKQYCQ